MGKRCKHLTLGEAQDILETLPNGYKASDTQATSLLHVKSISTAIDSESGSEIPCISEYTIRCVPQMIPYISLYVGVLIIGLILQDTLNHLALNKELLQEDILAWRRSR